MVYDSLKEFDGRPYTGMSIGGRHAWNYTHAVWDEQKIAPDKWEFTFRSVKERRRSAPEGSGAPSGTQYHWYIVADQVVRKIDKDAYDTFMSGVKHKVAHRRPHWRKWNCEYPGQLSARAKIASILAETLRGLEDEASKEGGVAQQALQADVGIDA